MMDPNNEQDREKMARLHNPPPEVPRQRMWARIDAARADRRGVVQPDFRPRRRLFPPALRLAGAIAALLLVGFFIGRVTQRATPVPGGDPVSVAAVQVPPVKGDIRKEVYTLAARDLFGRADFLLTDFKVRSCDANGLSATPEWAGDMLVKTRLLMGTSVAEDPAMKNLLDELELVLAQIVGLSRDNCARDMAWIRQGLQERSTIDRLRTVSAGSPI